jgi:hypothetical protein
MPSVSDARFLVRIKGRILRDMPNISINPYDPELYRPSYQQRQAFAATITSLSRGDPFLSTQRRH